MANYFMAQVKARPSFDEPEIIFTQAQASGAFEALENSKPRVKLSPGDLYVYVNDVDLRTETVSAQSLANKYPSATLSATYHGTQTYMIGARATYDHRDMEAASNYALALPAAQQYACQQGIFQQMRNGLLYGFNPANNEGLLNAQGAIVVSLPPDQFGNTTLQTYDSGDMALFFLNQVVNLRSGMFQSGGDINSRVVVVSPQRVFLQLSDAAVVQLTSYQRDGAGSMTTGGMIKDVMARDGSTFDWYFDDTLIGKGAGGTDAVILTIPEIKNPMLKGTVAQTNKFGSTMQPSMVAVNVMYADMVAPLEIPTPVPDGGITVIYELRVTAGWNLRPQGIYIIDMPY